MNEAAKQQHDLYKGVKDYVKTIKLANPGMPEDEDLNLQILEGGPAVGKFKRPSEGETLTDEELNLFITQSVAEVHDFVDEFWRKSRDRQQRNHRPGNRDRVCPGPPAW